MEAYINTASEHSIQRARERCNYKSRRAAENSILRALERGKHASDFSSWERNYLRAKAQGNCIAIACNNCCYIINNRGICVTVLRLPSWLGQKKRFDGKTIRDCRKYQRNHGHGAEEYCDWN